MSKTNEVRQKVKMSSQGQLSIPSWVRRELSLEPGQSLEVVVTGEGVYLNKAS